MEKIATHYDQLVDALRYLSSVCDGAHAQDGQGFNGGDSRPGKGMAADSYIKDLNPGQQRYAIKMIQKYRGQLEGAGMEIPLPSEYEILGYDGNPQTFTNKPTIKVEGDTIFVSFESVEKWGPMKDAVKTLPRRSWKPALPNKPWAVPLADLELLKKALPEGDYSNIKSAPLQQNKAQAPKSTGVEIKSNGRIYIHFSKDDPNFGSYLNRVRNLSDRKWEGEKEGKPWSTPTRIVEEVLEAFPEATVDNSVIELARRNKDLSNLSRETNSTFEVPGLKGEPRPYQRGGIEFLQRANGRAILADEMGLGKTLQALGYLQLNPGKRPAAIVVPSSLKINWEREIQKWLSTEENVMILSGRKAVDLKLLNNKSTPVSIYIINYDIISSWVDELLKVGVKVLIADEAHYCKNPKAKRTKAVAKLASKVNHKILITGTPTKNRTSELFPLLNMIDPIAWPNFFKFGLRYCNGHQTNFGWDFSGYSNLDELHEIIKPYFIRRPKSEVLKELPSKQRIVIPFELSKKDRRAYEDALREVANSDNQAKQLAQVEVAKQLAVKGKIKEVVNWIKDFLESGKKLVAFTTHNFTIDHLMNEFGDIAVQVRGSVKNKDRQIAVDQFQNNDKVRLFFGNIQAASVGLTLTAASDTAFVELPWTPGDCVQAEDRVHRIGQEADSVNAYYLIAEETIEEEIYRLLESKRVVTDTIHDGTATESPEFSIIKDVIAYAIAKSA